jgi:hypothetical protein
MRSERYSIGMSRVAESVTFGLLHAELAKPPLLEGSNV